MEEFDKLHYILAMHSGYSVYMSVCCSTTKQELFCIIRESWKYTCEHV